MGRFLGNRLWELCWAWFKANVWSLLSGIPVLIVNALLRFGGCRPNLGQRVLSVMFAIHRSRFVEFIAKPRQVGNVKNEVVVENQDTHNTARPAQTATHPIRTVLREFIPLPKWHNAVRRTRAHHPPRSSHDPGRGSRKPRLRSCDGETRNRRRHHCPARPSLPSHQLGCR